VFSCLISIFLRRIFQLRAYSRACLGKLTFRNVSRLKRGRPWFFSGPYIVSVDLFSPRVITILSRLARCLFGSVLVTVPIFSSSRSKFSNFILPSNLLPFGFALFSVKLTTPSGFSVKLPINIQREDTISETPKDRHTGVTFNVELFAEKFPII